MAEMISIRSIPMTPTEHRRMGDPEYVDKTDFQIALYDTIYLKKVGYQMMERYEAAVRLWLR
jgi:hypothetical protein